MEPYKEPSTHLWSLKPWRAGVKYLADADLVTADSVIQHWECAHYVKRRRPNGSQKRVSSGVVGFGRDISGLFKQTITVGKRVRTETNTTVGAVSVSSHTMELAFMKLSESSYVTTRMLVIGAGTMEKLVIKRLTAKGCTKMVIVNQSKGKSCRYHRGVQFRPRVPFR